MRFTVYAVNWKTSDGETHHYMASEDEAEVRQRAESMKADPDVIEV